MTGTRYARSGALRIAYELRGAMHRRPWLVLIQGMGFAVMEELTVEQGRITTSNLGDYKVPSIRDVPELTGDGRRPGT